MKQLKLGSVFCMNNLNLENNMNINAKAFVLSIDFCQNMLVGIDHVFGYSYVRKMDGNVMRIKMLGNNVAFRPKKKYNIGSICVIVQEKYIKNFSFKNHARIGADLHDDKLACSISDCKVDCGNGTCDDGENKNNCPIDCDTKMKCS